MTNKIKEYKQYFTPPCLADFMVRLIPSNNVKNIIDLSMGECGLLESAKKRWKNASLYGVDIDKTLISKINKKAPYIHTYCTDSLSNGITEWEEYCHVTKNGGFDLAIANPPFNFRDQAEVKIGNHVQVLPIEIRFLLKYIEIIKAGGFICIILPYGFLSLDLYRVLRNALLSEVKICKVIKLFHNCFKNIDANTCLILIQKKSISDYSIQQAVEIESLDEDYLITPFGSIPVVNDTDRLDLEYHTFLRDFPCLLKNSKFPIDVIATFTLECKRGKTLSNHKYLVSECGIRFLHTTDLNRLTIAQNVTTRITNETDYFNSAFVSPNSILVGRVGKGCIGKIAIIPEGSESTVISDCIWNLSVKNIDPYYLAIFLASKYGRMQFRGIAKGSCSKYITKKDLLNMVVLVPDIDAQLLFRKKYLSVLSLQESSDKNLLIEKMISELESFLEKE